MFIDIGIHFWLGKRSITVWESILNESNSNVEPFAQLTEVYHVEIWIGTQHITEKCV